MAIPLIQVIQRFTEEHEIEYQLLATSWNNIHVSSTDKTGYYQPATTCYFSEINQINHVILPVGFIVSYQIYCLNGLCVDKFIFDDNPHAVSAIVLMAPAFVCQ